LQIKYLSAKKVSDVVFEDTGIHVSERSILRDVKDGRAGESPKNMGRTGSIEPILFANLAGAFESHIRINQLNGKSGENVRKKLAAQVHKVVNRQSVMTNGATLQKLLD